MNGFDDDFLEFLRTNHPTDYILACSDDVKPESLRRIYNDYSKYFSAWIKVPESIRNTFGGRVPDEIIRLAAMGKDYILKEIAAGKQPLKPEDRELPPPPPQPEDILAAPVFAVAVAQGYSHEAAYELSLHSLVRKALQERAANGILNDKEKELWRQSREADKATIKKDWCNHQPEKMLLHLFAQYNRGKIDKDDFLPQVVDLMQKIETTNHRDHLLAYLKTKPVQAKLAHFKEDVLDTLSQTILHDIPLSERDDYLRASIPLKIQMRQLIDKDNNGYGANLNKSVNEIVERAKKDGIGLDLSNYTADSHHPMSANLRQMFMVACCINDVPYRCPDGEKINPNSDIVKNLPKDVQALVFSRDLRLAKQSMIEQTAQGDQAKKMTPNMPSILRSYKMRDSA